MWDRRVTSYWCERLGRRIEVPNLHLVELAWDFHQHQDTRFCDPPWVHASQLPDALRDAILDYYGEDDLTPTQRLLCAERLEVRKAASRPTAETVRPRRTSDAPRAGAATQRTPRRRTRRKT